MHSRTIDERPATSGRTIHWATRYDALVRLLTLGRDRRLRQETVALAQLAAGDRVLEVGCGTGEVALAAKAARPDAAIYGVDASPEMIAVARSKALRQGRQLELRVEPIEQLSFADGAFDVVLSSLMMHHLPDELKRQGLAQIRRVLRPGGRLVIVDFRRPTTRLAKAHLLLSRHQTMRHAVDDLPPLLEQAGFVALETGGLSMRSIGFVRGARG